MTFRLSLLRLKYEGTFNSSMNAAHSLWNRDLYARRYLDRPSVNFLWSLETLGAVSNHIHSLHPEQLTRVTTELTLLQTSLSSTNRPGKAFLDYSTFSWFPQRAPWARNAF